MTESSKSLGRPSQAASTKFPYVSLGQGTTLMPFVDVRVHLVSGSEFPLQMLPDSGATCTVIPRKYAVSLGYDIRECGTEKVDTGAGIAYQKVAPRPLAATVAGREIELYPRFAKIGVPVLGRWDFFSEFYVEVDERNRVVILTPHDALTSAAVA